MLDINIKRHMKTTHILSCAVWRLPREIFDLANESLNKDRGLKKHREWLQRRKYLNEKISAWEINIKDTFKNSMYLEIKWRNSFLNWRRLRIFICSWDWFSRGWRIVMLENEAKVTGAKSLRRWGDLFQSTNGGLCSLWMLEQS